ncbi:MAG: hypothetical protein MN733_00955 [Nitrososphaera sp.]|nr:hypothetical protein [Nitrososphaera sp.]
MTNEQKRIRAQYTLMQYREIFGQDSTASDSTDLLTNFLHYAHSCDIDPELTLETAKAHFKAEVNDDDNN